jgi:hypothetical protein
MHHRWKAPAQPCPFLLEREPSLSFSHSSPQHPSQLYVSIFSSQTPSRKPLRTSKHIPHWNSRYQGNMLPFATFLSLFIAVIGTASADIFMVNASLPGSWVDGQPINAAGQAFWVGGSPSTYCPSIVGTNCPNATAQTIIIAGFSALDVSKLLPLVIPCANPHAGRGSRRSANLC